MRISLKGFPLFLALLFIGTFVLDSAAAAQSTSGTIQGVIKDSSGAVVPGAKVEITDPVSAFHREAVTGSTGEFRFVNIPFNPYHMTVTAKSFAPYAQDVDVRSAVPLPVEVKLDVAGSATTVTVEGGGADLIETEPVFHTDVSRDLFDKLPLESSSSSVS